MKNSMVYQLWTLRVLKEVVVVEEEEEEEQQQQQQQEEEEEEDKNKKDHVMPSTDTHVMSHM